MDRRPLEPGHAPSRSRGLLTIQQAARACGVSEDTIRRRLNSGRLANATRTGTTWHIPVTDLINAGFQPDLSASTPTSSLDLDELERAHAAHVADLRDEIDRLHVLLRLLASRPGPGCMRETG